MLREYLILFVCGLPFMLMLGKLLFGSWHGFFEALRFMLTPDLVSLFRGEGLDDQWASLKLIVFYCCAPLRWCWRMGTSLPHDCHIDGFCGWPRPPESARRQVLFPARLALSPQFPRAFLKQSPLRLPLH